MEMEVSPLKFMRPPVAVILCLAATTSPAADVTYVSRIKKVFQHRCYACHGSLKQEAGLRLDTGQLIRKGSENGVVVNKTSVDSSLLLKRVMSKDPAERMPPIGMPLEPGEIAAIRSWIAAGSPSPADEEPEADPRDHWSFRPPVRPGLPVISRPEWAYNAVDRFVHARYDQHGLAPVGDADPAVLLRRVHLDLVGFPPSGKQLKAFRADPSQAHYRRVVDRLLASPRYGERWGRHWMDVWRYSDWYGRRKVNDVRNSAPQIWRWRDWIIESLNSDKSYARMVREMLAADELSATDDSAWPATGYLIRNYFSLNPNEWMRHSVEFTGKAFLGLTFNCAHCHDHKYDPITHDDYFRMRAFFEPMGVRQDRVPGQPDPPPYPPYVYSGSRTAVRIGMVRIFDERPDAKTWFYSGGDERNKDKERGTIAPGVPAFLADLFPPIQPIDLPLSGWYPGARPNIQQAVLEEQRREVANARAGLDRVTSQPVDVSRLQKQVDDARVVFDESLKKAVASGQAGALVGKQSMYLDAATGRRIVQNTLPGLKAVPRGTRISFQLRILEDNHVNFQLAKNTRSGLTALYVAFAGGKISSYRPNSYSEFAAATYDFAAGENHFHVSLEIDPGKDTVALSVKLDGADGFLVRNVPIALNGWNPTKNPHQPFTFDCRTGTKALVDQVEVIAGKQRFAWGFEPPRFTDGEDVTGIAGWTIHPQSQPAATSVVSMIAACEDARQSYTKLKLAERALAAVSLGSEVARKRLSANTLQLANLEATIAADNAKRNAAKPDAIEKLSREAYRRQLAAETAMAEWQVLDARYELARARALPASDKQKAPRIKKLEQQLSTAQKQGQEVAARRDKAADSVDYKLLSRVTSKTSTGRRASLARWITDSRNPLTPRVAVNHIWLRHFHSPLVETVYDFGRNGKLPSHPRLLDWLAVELLEHDWSMKRLHRLMVTSHVYQLAALVPEDDPAMQKNSVGDKDNRWLWRRTRGRMEAEVIRDSVLLLAGRLDSSLGGQVLLNTQAMTTGRRSLYYEVYPEAGGHTAFAELFDPPDPTDCFRRSSTVVPQQALALSNSELMHAASAETSRRIAGESREEFIRNAFVHVLSRAATDIEVTACREFWDKQMQELKDDVRVRESLVRVLFNHNDFVTIR
ncbi:MAG TPA: hypothetical protein DCE43_13410 [Planctomycetaceae bacterium]|nr:hypothetical protein [Planctomycetaceae bacterium]